MKKIAITAILLVTVILSSLPALASSQEPSSWAREQVTAAINLGLVPQSLQSEYTRAITRIEFCTLAVTFFEATKGEIKGRSTFSDTSDISVEKAASVGIISGVGNNKFSPNDNLTREQAAVILSNLADALGKQLPWWLPIFADNANISSWAVDGVGLVQASGIMGGTGGNKFSPGDPYTREQSICTIMRMRDVMAGTAVFPQKPMALQTSVNSLPISDSLKRGMTTDEFNQAYEIAYSLVSDYASFNTEVQITGVFNELAYIRHNSYWSYSMTDAHYNNIYGFFVLNRTSCAGDVRAAAICLTILGIPYEHVNENQSTHQWIRAKLGDRYVVVDINAGWIGYELVPYEHPLMQ